MLLLPSPSAHFNCFPINYWQRPGHSSLTRQSPQPQCEQQCPFIVSARLECRWVKQFGTCDLPQPFIRPPYLPSLTQPCPSLVCSVNSCFLSVCIKESRPHLLCNVLSGQSLRWSSMDRWFRQPKSMIRFAKIGSMVALLSPWDDNDNTRTLQLAVTKTDSEGQYTLDPQQ